MVKNRSEIDPKAWTENHALIVKRAAKYDRVARIFVHPPIKKELCKWATVTGHGLPRCAPSMATTIISTSA